MSETHPGFTVTCDACGSTNVVVESDVGWSEASGGWGGVSLACVDCDAAVTVWEPY